LIANLSYKGQREEPLQKRKGLVGVFVVVEKGPTGPV
jgi:hypothetical protein